MSKNQGAAPGPEQQQAPQGEQPVSAETVQPQESPLKGVGLEWPAPPPLDACSWNECTKGHKFPPLIQVARCPGCGQPVVAVKMVNCPVCNEPVAKLAVRFEHAAGQPNGHPLTAQCQGQPTLNEVQQIMLYRAHAEEEEARYKDREMVSKA